MAESRIRGRAAWPSPLLISRPPVARRAGGHGYIGRMGGWSRAIEVGMAVLHGFGIPWGILVKVYATLRKMIGRILASQGGFVLGEIVNGDGRFRVGRQALEGDGGDDTSGHVENRGVIAVHHGAHRGGLGMTGRARAGGTPRGAWGL